MEYMIENESEQMYLKEIFVLSMKYSKLRAVNICDDMGYGKASVSRGLKKLQAKNFISIDNNIISLTQSGLSIASKIYQKYIVLYNMFSIIGLDNKDANKLACKMEHILSDEIFDKMLVALKNHCRENLTAQATIKFVKFLSWGNV